MPITDNVNRVQGSFVSQSRSRWLINVVLVMAVIAFVGFSMIPLFSTALKEIQPSTVATPSQTPVADQQSQLQQQAQGYELVLQREPENQTALRGLVESRIRLRDFKGAIAPMEKLAQLNPNQNQLRLILGELYASQKRYDEAIAVYDQAINADKQDFRPVLAKAVLLKQQGKTEQAKPLFENATALAPAQYKDQIKAVANEGVRDQGSGIREKESATGSDLPSAGRSSP